MIVVAIDGPAGAGKSTIAKAASASLGYIYIDTGALYRAVALACIKQNINTNDNENITKLLSEIDIRLVFLNGAQRILLNEDDVTDEIRAENVSMAASAVSAIPFVRDFLLELQRSFAKNDNVIMDGRDIGTVVLPNADVKIFLTASPEKRARRRVLQLEQSGIYAEFDKVLFDIVQRDYNDTHRKTAPLKAADDSITVDTTDMTLEQSVEKIINIIKENTI